MLSGYNPQWDGHFTFLVPFVHRFKKHLYNIHILGQPDTEMNRCPHPCTQKCSLHDILPIENSGGAGEMDVMKQCDVTINTWVFQGQTLSSGCLHI
jgi:hypothetical protein